MADGWLDDRQATNAFLRFGYVPGEPDLDPYLRGVELDERPGGDRAATVARGEAALSAAFDRCLARCEGDQHVLPLSGGLDSRTILAELLERVGTDRIQTVTFGVPGTWDYDIPKRIVRQFDFDGEFVALDSRTLRWSNELVADHCDPRQPVPVVERTVNRYAQKLTTEEEAVYWSGFNVETGATSMQSHRGWDRAVEDFLTRNTVCDSLEAPGVDPKATLPDEPLVSRDVLPYDQQLDYGLRQEYYSKPLLFPQNGVRLALPFMERPWRQFCLTLPPERRRNRRTFERILRSRYPELFSFPVDSHSGMALGTPTPLPQLKGLALRVLVRVAGALGREFAHPRRNYYDFESFFARADVAAWVESNLVDLADRDEFDWLRPESVWRQYRRGAPLGNELRLLLSLELYRKMWEGTSGTAAYWLRQPS